MLRRVVAVRFSIALDRVRYSVAEHLRICNLVEYNGIDPHGYVILCDNQLRCKINYLLFLSLFLPRVQ